MYIREYSTSRIEARSYFKDQPVYRCEVQEMTRFYYFFGIFYCSLHYYKPLVQNFEYFNEMVSGNDCKYCNVIESWTTVFKCFKIIFLIYAKRNVLHNEDEEY